MIELTWWPSLTDPRGRRARYFEHGLARVFEAAARRPHAERGWSPGTFERDRRKDESCEHLFAIGIDCEHEDKACKDDPKRLGCPGRLAEVLQLARWRALVHTTRNHREKAPRSRAIVFTSRPVSAEEYRKLWAALAAVVEAGGLRVDRSTKNESRLWYLPSIDAEGNPAKVRELEGSPLDVDLVLDDLAEREAIVEESKASAAHAAPKPPERRAVGGDLYQRARAYLAKVEPGISGSAGHNQTFAAARKLAGFVHKGLAESDGWALLEEYNATCQPPWSAKDLQHKWSEAMKARTLPALEDRPAQRSQTSERSRDGGERESSREDFKPARPLTDLGNAERMHDAHGADLKHCAGLGRLVWSGKLWELDQRHEWDRRAQRTVRDLYASAATIEDDNVRKATIDWARKSESREKLSAMCALAETLEGVTVTTEQLDVDRFALNCGNGTVDLRTGDIRPHRREDLITKIAGCDYVKGATCPTFDRFMLSTFAGDAALIAFLQRFVGYCLTGDVREHVLLFCYGEGANGKSTLIDLVIDMLGGFGGYAAPSAPGLLVAKKGEQHPTELADLLGRRVVTCVEIGDGKRFDEERVKGLTGGDRIKGRLMRKDFFTFAPTHKLVVAANHKPIVRGTDLGIWRRILLVPFLVTFGEGQKDRELAAKLRAELPGILAWAVRGCLAWQRAGLQPPPIVLEATSAYQAEQDTVGRFLEDRCLLNPRVRAKSGSLYEAFRTWCTEQGEHEMNQRRFGEQLLRRNLKQTRLTGGTRAWEGVGLLADAQNDAAEHRRFAS